MPSSSASAETAVLSEGVSGAAGLTGLPPAAVTARMRRGELPPAGEPPADDGGRGGSGSACQKQMCG